MQTTELVPATISVNPFTVDRFVHEWTPGETVADILDAVEIERSMWNQTRVFLNDIEIKPEYYHVCRPHADVLLTVKVLPGGDNNVLRSIAFIALAVAVTVVTGPGGAFYVTGNAWATAAWGAGLYAAGALAVNALIPAETPELDNGEQASQALSVGAARNRLDPYGVLPIVYGSYRVTPPFVARPYTRLQGDQQFVVMLFTVGKMPVEVNKDSIWIGNTPLNSYEGVSVELLTGGSEDTGPITLYQDTVFEDIVGKQIPGGSEQGYAQHTSAADTDSLTYEITFPQGIIKYDKNDDGTDPRTVVITVEYSSSANGPWQSVNVHTFKAKSPVPIRKGYKWSAPSRGTWHIRMRADVENRTGARKPYTFTERFFALLRSYRNEPAVADPDISQIAIELTATDQLNGIPDQVSMFCQSILPDWDGNDWTDAITANPASIARDILTGKNNARALDPATRIDDQSFVDFWNYCETNDPRVPLRFNQHVDFNTTVFNQLLTVCRSAFSKPIMVDAKWTIFTDKPQTVPRQVFTPRNTWGFGGSKIFPEQPHAFRCRFIDETDDPITAPYQNDEIVVYADGHSEDSATLFEAMETIGVTNWDQVWKIARRYLAIGIHQAETFTFSVDVENLVTTVGDLVLFQQDSVYVGLGQGRVKDIDSNTVTLDAAMPFAPGTQYAIQFRSKTGDVSTAILVEDDSGLQETLTFEVPGVYGDIGDLVIFGEHQAISQQLLIKNIEPGTDLSARITCIPYSDAIYTADTGQIPPYDPVITVPPGTSQPIIVNIVSDETVMWRDAGGTLQSRMLITLGFLGERSSVQSLIYEYRVYSSDPNNAIEWVSLPILPGDASLFTITDVQEGQQVELRGRFLFRDGTSGEWLKYYDDDADTPYHTVIGQTTRPPDLGEFSVVVQASGLREYHWAFAPEVTPPPDLDGFLIKYFDADNLTGDPVEYGLQNGDTYGDQDQPGDYYGLQYTADVPDWNEMEPLTTGRITHQPFEYNAPYAGPWYFAIVALDVGGRESEFPLYTPLMTLPAPQLGNSLFYLDHWANRWLVNDTPGAVQDASWQRSDATGYLQAVVTNTWHGSGTPATWADMGIWKGQGAGGSFTYTHETGVNTFDPALSATTDIRLNTTTDSAGGSYTFWYAFNGGGDPVTDTGWTQFVDGDVVDNGASTTTSIEFRIKGTSVPNDGLRNWVVEGYASAGA